MRNRKIDWEELPRRHELIGGEAELMDSGLRFIGRICEIRYAEWLLIVLCDRGIVRDERKRGPWRRFRSELHRFCSQTSKAEGLGLPTLLADGNVELTVMGIGRVTLRPCGRRTVNTADVQDSIMTDWD